MKVNRQEVCKHGCANLLKYAAPEHVSARLVADHLFDVFAEVPLLRVDNVSYLPFVEPPFDPLRILQEQQDGHASSDAD